MIRLDPSPDLLGRFSKDLLASVAAPSSLAPDLAAHGAEDHAAAHLAWTERIVDEYRSVVVFAELLQRMGECEAPFDALCAVHALLGDELRHTALCARAAAWFGPPSRFEVDLAGLGLPPSDDPPLVRSLEIVVREIVVAEAESVTSFLAHRDAASDPAARAALSVLFRDEVRHAAAGLALRDTLAAMGKGGFVVDETRWAVWVPGETPTMHGLPAPWREAAAIEKPAAKKPAAKKPAPTAREADKARKRLTAAREELKQAKRTVRAVTQLQAKYRRQLDAATAGLKTLLGKERALEKEVAALTKAGAGRAPRKAAKAA